MRQVQSALILVSLVAVFLAGCSWNDPGDSSTTAVPKPDVATTTLRSATSSVSGAIPVAEALLANDDLPPGYGWIPVPIEEDFWGMSGTGIVVHFCEDWRNVVSEPSLMELTTGMPAAVSFGGNGAHVNQVVYAHTSPGTQVEVAFDDVASELDECIAWWEQNPASGIGAEYVEEGLHWAVAQFELPTIGVESYGITYRVDDAAGMNVWTDLWMNHTIAMVRTETHLMVLELYGNSGADRLQGSRFASIVDSAVKKLSDEEVAERTQTVTWQGDPCESTPPPSGPKRYSSDDEFAFGTDSLCDLFTADEISAVVAAAYETHGLEVPRGQAGWHCCVETQGSSNTSLEVVALSETAYSFESTEGLPSNVRVRDVSRGCVAFIPGFEAEVHVDGHDEVLLFAHFMPWEFRTPSGCDPEGVNPVGLTILTEVLRQMGWI